MNKAGYRWVMNATGQALAEQGFAPAPPGKGEVTVEVAGCGVCHTDLGYFYDGIKTNHPLPLTLGHEISGRVIAAGEGAQGLEGKAVIIPAVMPCGECDMCMRGLGNICRSQKMPGNDIDGGFASHVTVPAATLCVVDEARLAQAGLELAEVAVLADAVTTPYQAAVLAAIQPGDLAVVIGAGGIGTYAVQIAKAMGATVVAIDIDPDKLEKLTDYGASLTLDAAQYDQRELKKAVREFAGQAGVRMTEWKILECSGTAAGQASAFSLLTFGAHLAIVGFTMDKVEVRLSNLMAFNARLQGNWGCLPEYYPEALALVLSGKVKMKPFIRLYPLKEINSIFAQAHAHKLAERAILVP